MVLMAGVRKTSGPSAARGVVYDLAKSRAGASATVDNAGRTDSSGITDGARELASALRIVQEAEEARTERMLALKAQIANGTYNPDPREIARKLVERGF
jgi:flagellar biosynthesis anti-sigma factor FlgM